MNAVQQLQAAIADLHKAALEEKIELDGTLRVWLRAQVTTLKAMAGLVQEQTERIEDKAAAVERAMQAEVARVKAAVEEARGLTNRLKADIENNKERRMDDNLALAKELGEGIKSTLKDAMLIRERRWNRRQNWTVATLSALLLTACFVGGATWREHQRPTGTVQEVMDRCLARQVLDEVTHQYFCPVKIVQGKL